MKTHAFVSIFKLFQVLSYETDDLILQLFFDGFLLSSLFTVNIVTRLWVGQPQFNLQLGQGIFLLTTASRLALWLTHPLIQWVPGALSLGVK
jgi:hypothetical protein